ncbi:hypothetical protein GJU43_09825, partial [Flavobacterium sp. LC2016-23]|uniref:RHS repeat domain-containing protein n=1 Tax=Flavobacterium sp. LC2016-23 TaxID=2666330 RepID=UPI0013A06DFF
DYYPFGMLVPNRHADTEEYRYGFTGMPKDDELKGGQGNSYDYGARMYDPRVGRWFAPDKMERKFPQYSPYNYSLNNPILVTDPDGKDPIISGLTEAATAFMLSVGVDFLSSYLLEGNSAEEAFHDIGWFSASWDGVKAWGESSIVPGSATASRIVKLSKTKIGKVLIAITEEMVKGTVDAYMQGKFNNKQTGEFDFGEFSTAMKGIGIESIVQGLIDTGFKGAAEKVLEKYADNFKSLKRLEQKLERKIANGDSAKRISNYTKKITKQQDKINKIKETYKKVKMAEEVGTAAAGKVVSKKTKEVLNVE